MSASQWTAATLFAAGLAVFAWWWLPASGVAINDNSAMYLQQAARIARAEDPGLTFEGRSARGPLFPAAIAVAFKLVGRGVEPAMYVSRLGLIVAIAAAAALAYLYAGLAAGFGAALLVATSYGLSYAGGSLDTDLALPAAVLVSLAVLEMSIRRDSVGLAAVAGILLAAAFLVKESAVVFLAVPLAALWLRADPASQKRRRRLAVLHAAAIAVLLPWAIAVAWRYGADALFGVMHPGVQERNAAMQGFDTPLRLWLYLLTLGAPRALSAYVEADLSNATPLAWIIAASWIGIAAVAVRNADARRLLVWGLAFAPVLISIGAKPGRIGQTTVFMALSAVAIAVLTAWLVRRAVTSRAVPGLTAAALSAMALVQLIAPTRAGASTLDIWREGRDAAAPLRRLSGAPFKVTGRFTVEQQHAAIWLAEHGAKRPAADGYSNEALAFFADVRDVPVFTPYESVALWRDGDVDGDRLRDPIAVMTYNGFQRGQSANLEVFIVTQRRILEELATLQASHLVLAGRSHYLVPYLDRAPWATRVFEESSVLIYELEPAANRVPLSSEQPPPVLLFRTGDGTRGAVTLTDQFERYEAGGNGAEEDNIFFYLDRKSHALLDEVAFEVQVGGRWRNLLAPDDSTFEGGIGNWVASGTQQIRRAAAAGRAGTAAMALTALDAGGEQSIASLTNPFFEFSGGRNRFVFWARSPRETWLCVNEALPGDIAWLAEAYPAAAVRLQRAFAAMGVTAERVATATCVMPNTYTP